MKYSESKGYEKVTFLDAEEQEIHIDTYPDKKHLFIYNSGEDYGLILNKRQVHNLISVLQSFVHHDSIGTYGYFDKEVS